MNVANYMQKLFAIIHCAEVTDSAGKQMLLEEGVLQTVKVISELNHHNRKLMFIGNGGSAAIASHEATDFLKNGKIRAMSLNEGSLLTCFSNDYGYENVFYEPLKLYADSGDLLFAISSSGKSLNILRGVESARINQCKIITLSGFSRHNALRKMGDINFFIPSYSYGFVELAHQILLHMTLEMVMENNCRTLETIEN